MWHALMFPHTNFLNETLNDTHNIEKFPYKIFWGTKQRKKVVFVWIKMDWYIRLDVLILWAREDRGIYVNNDKDLFMYQTFLIEFKGTKIKIHQNSLGMYLCVVP